MKGSSVVAGIAGVLAGALISLIAVGGASARRDPALVGPAPIELIALSPLTPDASAMPRLRARLEQLEADGQFMGVVLVAQGDRLLMREAYGPADSETGQLNTPDDRFRLASLSKQFTAAAILRLQDQGRLSIDDPVCRWISHWTAGSRSD